MAFDSGTALNPNDLLDKLRLFLVAQGWTQDFWAAESGNQRLHLHKGGWYFNAKVSNDGTNIWPQNGIYAQCLGFNLSTALALGNAWYDQTGAARDLSARGIGSCLPLPSGPITGYLFFYEPAYESLVIYVQTMTGVWRWAGFGQSLLKAGAWTGGAWITGCADSYSANQYPAWMPGHGSSFAAVYPFGANRDYNAAPLLFLRADVDAYTNKWLSCSPTDQTGKAGDTNVAGGSSCSSNIPALAGLLERSRNALNSLSVLLPVQIYAARDAGGKSLLGTLPNIFASNVSGLALGQPYTLGSDQYYPFPADAPGRGTVVKRA